MCLSVKDKKAIGSKNHFRCAVTNVTSDKLSLKDQISALSEEERDVLLQDFV